MTRKVVRLIDSDRLALLKISGHLQEVHIEMIDELLAKETDPVALDLGEVSLFGFSSSLIPLVHSENCVRE